MNESLSKEQMSYKLSTKLMENIANPNGLQAMLKDEKKNISIIRWGFFIIAILLGLASYYGLTSGKGWGSLGGIVGIVFTAGAVLGFFETFKFNPTVELWIDLKDEVVNKKGEFVEIWGNIGKYRKKIDPDIVAHKNERMPLHELMKCIPALKNDERVGNFIRYVSYRVHDDPNG